MQALSNRVDEIEQLLSAHIEKMTDNSDIGVVSGMSGLAMFYAQLMQFKPGSDYNNQFEKIFTDSINILNQQSFSPYHCSGLSGFLFALQHFKEIGILDEDIFEFNERKELDQFVFKTFQNALSYNNFDFLQGADGLLCYMLKSKYAIESAIDLYLKQLASSKYEFKEGIAWKSPVQFETQMVEVFNMGLAHGMASKMAILARIITHQPSIRLLKKAKDLLSRLVAFYHYESQIGDQTICTYSNYSRRDHDNKPSRLAWCYGDLSICIPLWQAGYALQDKSVMQLAIEIGLKTCRRKNLDEAHCFDAGFCHGTSGIGHIYHRLFEVSGKAEFAEAEKKLVPANKCSG